MIDLDLIWNSLPTLLYGTCVSLQITCVAAAIGLCCGSLLGLSNFLYKSKLISLMIESYVALFRGTPMLVQILFIFYALPQMGITLDPFWAASLAIGFNSCAYISQIIRGGVENVSKGQIEAAYTLGFSPIKMAYWIVFPQAFRAVLPALTNELITLIKDSSLASIIGVVELAKEASIIRSRTYDAFSVLLAVAIIYLLLTTTLSFIMKNYELKWRSYA